MAIVDATVAYIIAFVAEVNLFAFFLSFLSLLY